MYKTLTAVKNAGLAFRPLPRTLYTDNATAIITSTTTIPIHFFKPFDASLALNIRYTGSI